MKGWRLTVTQAHITSLNWSSTYMGSVANQIPSAVPCHSKDEVGQMVLHLQTMLSHDIQHAMPSTAQPVLQFICSSRGTDV